MALNVTEIELQVLEATNEEPWGPHGQAMQGAVCGVERAACKQLQVCVGGGGGGGKANMLRAPRCADTWASAAGDSCVCVCVTGGTLMVQERQRSLSLLRRNFVAADIARAAEQPEKYNLIMVRHPPCSSTTLPRELPGCMQSGMHVCPTCTHTSKLVVHTACEQQGPRMLRMAACIALDLRLWVGFLLAAR